MTGAKRSLLKQRCPPRPLRESDALVSSHLSRRRRVARGLSPATMSPKGTEAYASPPLSMRVLERPSIAPMSLSKTPSPEHDDLEYEGETRARSRREATALAMLAPGLAYAYIGQPILAITVNLLIVLSVVVFIIAMAWLQFFPLLPLLVGVVGWGLVTWIVALDVRDRIKREHLDEEYLLAASNHWLPYAMIALVTLWIPIVVCADLTLDRLFTVAHVGHDGMYPTLMRGDVVLIDRQRYDKTPPQRGEIVAVSASEDSRLHLLRVVGVAQDVVRLDGGMLYIDEQPLEHTPFSESEALPVPAQGAPPMIALVEFNGDERYVVSMARGAIANTSIRPMQLSEGEFFVLADNRSQLSFGEERGEVIRDSRNFGALEMSTLRGAPSFILWSSSPAHGTTRFGRIGLRIE